VENSILPFKDPTAAQDIASQLASFVDQTLEEYIPYSNLNPQRPNRVGQFNKPLCVPIATAAARESTPNLA